MLIDFSIPYKEQSKEIQEYCKSEKDYNAIKNLIIWKNKYREEIRK